MSLDKLLTNSWMNNSVVLAQIAHVLGGYGIILTAAFLWGHVAAVIAAVLLTAYAAVKEFWYDLKYETDPVQNWKDSLLDFSMYMVGMTSGLLLVFLHHSG